MSLPPSLTCCPSSAVSASSGAAPSHSDSALEEAAQFPLVAPASAASEAAEVAVDSSRSAGSAAPPETDDERGGLKEI